MSRSRARTALLCANNKKIQRFNGEGFEASSPPHNPCPGTPVPPPLINSADDFRSKVGASSAVSGRNFASIVSNSIEETNERTNGRTARRVCQGRPSYGAGGRTAMLRRNFGLRAEGVKIRDQPISTRKLVC